MNRNFENMSLLFASNAVYIEQLYEIYLSDPSSIDSSWHSFFQNFYEPNIGQTTKSTSQVVVSDIQANNSHVKNEKLIPHSTLVNSNQSTNLTNKFNLKAMIDAYRNNGHYLVNLDPLGLEKTLTKSSIGLNIEDFGYVTKDLDAIVKIEDCSNILRETTLENCIAQLDKIYASTIGFEIKQVENNEEYQWLCDTIEKEQLDFSLAKKESLEILKLVTETECFEQYLHTKFPGAKRFSIEGGESYIVSLNKLIDMAANNGYIETIIGMAHRGRLSSLTQSMNKPYRALFSEFAGKSAFPSKYDVSGDVKYHMGYSSEYVHASGNKMRLSLSPNPSHLEAVNTVVAGKVRAQQDLAKDAKREKVLAVLVHGDAAFCGQGVVAEGLVMSTLAPYSVGGIIHLVINNQVGFTANSFDGHSGRYATEVAKSTATPIFHVNGDDLESVIKATYIAMNYKNKFGKDVVIDIICYRKYGHNEGDEPMYTQSVMYNIIKNKKSPATLYADHLQKMAVISLTEVNNIKTKFKSKLDEEYEEAQSYQPVDMWFKDLWHGFVRKSNDIVNTAVQTSVLQDLGSKLCEVPQDFALSAKLKKLFDLRQNSLKSGQNIDWATAEQLAFATILTEGFPIRLTGQDSGRGTFSHRHSVLHDQANGKLHIPLNNLSNKQEQYFVADSNLSEYGVLGFEYGYSTINPKSLVIWEAQFGDFANGAQILFDQFIAASETKWLEMSGLVVLLPHGFEGQGPEHSSSRLERFLSLAAEDNIQVCYPTLPASFFHLLRRQIYSKTRKPLIVLTPKSLLRHKLAVSSLSDFANQTHFIPIIDEIDKNIDANLVKRVIICTGKVYYDLYEKRTEKCKDVALIRIEQLYPLEIEQLKYILARYSKASEFIWCQEEPNNMGAWAYINSYLDEALEQLNIAKRFKYVGRKAAASPSVGYLSVHNAQQDKLLDEALNR